MARPDVSIDLTPEEFALMLGEERTTPSSPIPPVTALIAAHLNGKQLDQARRYARCLALGGQRIGLIYIDASEFRLLAFDLNQEAASPPGSAETECFDLRAMGEAINAMSCDVDRCLLLVGSTRLPEARAILRNTSQWVLLTTCDPDGVVGAYRTLKGLASVPSIESRA